MQGTEAIIIPTYGRPELLFCCLERIREIEQKIPVFVFPDRGTWKDPEISMICERFGAKVFFVPKHDFYGNTYNTMEAYRWSFNAGFDRVFYVESDVICHDDFFSWHRTQQEDFPDIFASMAWIFNRHAPITDDILFQPWFYSIGVCFSRHMLELVVEHCTPNYYADLKEYIRFRFGNKEHNLLFDVAHFEQDGVLQRVLNEHRLQTVSPGIAKCSHVGFVRSYGDSGAPMGYEYFMRTCKTFDERVKRLKEFIRDPYWRMQYFDRAIVEREEGREIGERKFHYRMIQGEWESEFVSNLLPHQLPRKVNSVPITPETRFVLQS